MQVGEHTLVIKTYATGREANEIEQVLLSGAKVNMIGGAMAVESFSPSIQQDANRKAVELLVVSLDGDANSVLERVLDLPNALYLEVIEALNEALGKKKASA